MAGNKDNRKKYKGDKAKTFSDVVEDNRAHWESYEDAEKRVKKSQSLEERANRIAEEHDERKKVYEAAMQMEPETVIREGELRPKKNKRN